jgi:hypothetical protein
VERVRASPAPSQSPSARETSTRTFAPIEKPGLASHRPLRRRSGRPHHYHRHVVAKKTYATMDHHVWQALWRWARRRHPNKSCGWVRRKYFRTLGHRHWVFATSTRRCAAGHVAGRRQTLASTRCWHTIAWQLPSTPIPRPQSHRLELATLARRQRYIGAAGWIAHQTGNRLLAWVSKVYIGYLADRDPTFSGWIDSLGLC